MESDVDDLEALFRDWSIDTENHHCPTFTPPSSPSRKESTSEWATELLRQLRAVEASQAHDTVLTLLQAFETRTLSDGPSAERLQRVSNANQILYKAVMTLKQSHDNSRRNVLLVNQREKQLQEELAHERNRVRDLEEQCSTLRCHLSLALYLKLF
eukprot:GEMP01118274.1.p1 GENE.GEMP01118274.1~~GEMP01118274.1.p1  ORF type:complete len:164 (+),score=25.87 GEMP01118274.1:27-494(+)